MSKHSIQSDDSNTSSKRQKSNNSNYTYTEIPDSLMKVPILPSQTSQNQVISIPINLNNEDYLNRLNYLLYNKKNLQKHLNLIDQLVRNDIKINNI